MGMGNVHKLSMFTNVHKSQMKSLFAENWRAIRTAAGRRPYHMGDSWPWEGRTPIYILVCSAGRGFAYWTNIAILAEAPRDGRYVRFL